MSTSFPELDLYYGLLSGMIFDIPYSICGLLSAVASRSNYRVLILGAFMALMSGTQIATACTTSFGVLVGMRWLFAMFAAMLEPTCYSLVADYFPSYRRAQANSFLAAGNYFGMGFSSASIILIKNLGWRKAQIVISGMGVLSGALALLFLREPRQEQKKKQ